MASGLRPGGRDPAGWLLPARPRHRPGDAWHPETHLSSVTSVCTEGGVQCAYDANGEQWMALLVPRAWGSCPRPCPITRALCSPQPASAPTGAGTSILGTSSTTRRTAWGAASRPAVGPTAPSREGSTAAAPPRPPPRPPSPSLHPCLVRQTRWVPRGAAPHPSPRSGRSQDPAEHASLGQPPCSQEGPASSRPPGRTDATVLLSGLRLQARDRRCKRRCLRPIPRKRTTGSPA